MTGFLIGIIIVLSISCYRQRILLDEIHTGLLELQELVKKE